MAFGIDFQAILKKQLDKIFAKYNIDTDPIYTPWFRKSIKFFGYKFMPVVIGIASFFILLKIFGTVLDKYGVERLLVLFMTIYVMSIRSKSQT
jgi:hypothetical protein